MLFKAPILILFFIFYGAVCFSEPQSLVLSKIESPNLSDKELKELVGALGINLNEKISPSALNSKLKKIYNEETYEVLFFEIVPKGKETVLVIKGSKLKKVKKVTFTGIENEIADEIRKDLEIREGKPIGSQYLASIRDRIDGMLEHRGYFYSKTEVKLKEMEDGKEWEIEVNVQKNKSTVISKISFKGVSKDLREQIRSYVTFSVGDVFKKADLVKSGENLNSYFKKNQYPTTRLEDTTLIFSQDKLSVEVVFLIKQGEKYQFQFTGNTVFPDDVLREFLTDEVLSQADATNKIVSLIESKYKSVGYNFCQVKIETESFPQEKLNIVYFKIDEGKKLLIDRVDFNGAERVGPRLLEKWMYEEAPGVLARGVYWEEGLKELGQKLQIRMRKEGYLSATVSVPRSVFTEDRMGAELIFEVQPGQRTFLHSIDIEGEQRLTKSEILKSINEKTNEPFNLEKIEEVKSRILNTYLREGFADVQVKGAFKNNEPYEISQDQKQADIKLLIVEGPQYFVGDIVVEGNKRTDSDVIEREVTLKRGDKYDLQKVHSSEGEVHSLGLFTRVEIIPSTSPKSNLIKDLKVVVLEGKRGFGEVGLGGAYEDPRFKMRTFFGVTYKNLFGRNQTVSARNELDIPFSGGYHLIPFLEYSTTLRYRMPYPLSLPFIFSSEAGLDSFESFTAPDGTYLSLSKRSKIEEKIERKISSSVTLLYRLHRYEHNRIENIQIKDRPERDQNGNLIPRLADPVEEDIGSTGPGLILDFRDDPFNPTKGSYHTFDIELASKLLLSQSDFYMATLRNSFYFPLYNSWGFTFFIGGGFADSTTDEGVLPKARRGFDLALGGQGSIRGYSLKTLVPQETSHSAAYYNTRMEISVPIFTNISAAVFLDSGQIYSRKISEPWKTDPRYDGIGIGFRYKTAVGPVVFDMAEGLTAPGKVVKFLFNIGTF